MNMLWTEKYRPTKLIQIRGQDEFVLDAESWIKDPSMMTNLLLHGVAGTGKTTAALVLAKTILGDESGGNFYEINASDDRKLEVVRTTIKEIATTRRLGDVPFKIVLLDEMDGMTRDAQNSLKRLMERYSENCRFIITCNHSQRIISPLQSRCANYRFHRLQAHHIRIVLETILQTEEINTVNTLELEAFIEGLSGDLRRGITELQAAVASNTPLLRQSEKLLRPYEELLKLVLFNKHEEALEEVHKMLHKSLSMNEICINLHDSIVKGDMEHSRKFKLLRVI